MSIQQALISVSDKRGIVEFARGLHDRGIRIISSGGTYKVLSENGIPCREISDVTGFPEILDGRVKTLQPKIHGGILARRDKPAHLDELKKHSITPVDIVVVNLYPFEETLARRGTDDDPAGFAGIPEDIIENIDIGGVALLRAASKNFRDVLVLTAPSDYAPVLERIKDNAVTPEFRRELAAKAFRHTAYYDSLISGYFTKEKFPAEMAVPLKKIMPLRYGENPHQEASLYRQGVTAGLNAVVTAKQLQGKELSYNNYLDLESAWNLVLEFEEPACGIIKHNNPCGCAAGGTILDAYARALACDLASAFGGILAFNRPVDGATAAEIAKLFTECIVAPAFTPEARAVLEQKKNLRLLEMPPAQDAQRPRPAIELRNLTGGMLLQDKDLQLLSETKPVTKAVVSERMSQSLLFAWKVCKHVKSNAIILVRGLQTVGIGAGQMSRIDSLHIAEKKMKEVKFQFDELATPLVLASDAFFPFNDVVTEAAKIGVRAIIQPGGSIRDADSIAAADANGIAMLFTGMRHFRH